MGLLILSAFVQSRQIDLSSGEDRELKNLAYAGKSGGGTCKCANSGLTYNVGALGKGCKTLACFGPGAEPGTCDTSLALEAGGASKIICGTGVAEKPKVQEDAMDIMASGGADMIESGRNQIDLGSAMDIMASGGADMIVSGGADMIVPERNTKTKRQLLLIDSDDN